MDSFIGNIFYFGAPKDGFKVYPDLGSVSNIFSGYYSNSETDWFLLAKKTEAVTRYTYVRYGLLTSTVEGRTGSCFGISIDFFNHYFTDLNVFRTQIVEGVWGAILDDRKLLEIQESSGKIAFKSYDFFDVGEYLDEMSKRIRAVIADSKYSNYIRPSYEVPDADDNPVYGLHPDSSPSAIREYFKTYGVIKLSPKLPLETKSISEKAEEHKQNLLQDVERLTGELRRKDLEFTELLRQRDEEIQKLNQRLEKLRGFVDPIFNEFSFNSPRMAAEASPFDQRTRSHNYQSSIDRPAQMQTYAPTIGIHPRNKQKQHTPHDKRFWVGIAIIVFVFLAIIFLYFYAAGEEPDVVTRTVQFGSEPTAARAPTPLPVGILITVERGKRKAFLNASVFLEEAKGSRISNEAEFKELLTSYLFRTTPEVVIIYRGNKEELWTNMMALNPKSKSMITKYLRDKAPFTIENSEDQQNLLKDMIIFNLSV